MKKNRILGLILLLTPLLVHAQVAPAGSGENLSALFDKAMGVVMKSGGKQSEYVDAYNNLLLVANSGVGMAMNAVGKLNLEGKGCPVNIKAGVEWLEKAGAKQYYEAYHNLGVIYKCGMFGVPQDLTKAFEYFSKTTQPNRPFAAGCYDVGFFLYKGLGCKQDYDKAFSYFKIAAENQYLPSIYMVGLCYKNGYGVKQDLLEGRYWLQAAEEKKYPDASKELLRKPENSFVTAKAKVSKLSAVPASHPKLSPLKPQMPLKPDGQYVGVITQYDWSGKIVLSEKPVKLSLTKKGADVVVDWEEQEVETAPLQAMYKDGSLVFVNAYHGRKGHYDATHILWRFANERLAFANDGVNTSLFGYIRMFSPVSLEPSLPYYLNVQKVEDAVQTTAFSNAQVYPNPIEKGMNVSINMKTSSEIVVSAFSSNAALIKSVSLGVLPQGLNQLMVPISALPEPMIIQVSTGTQSYQTMMVQKDI